MFTVLFIIACFSIKTDGVSFGVSWANLDLWVMRAALNVIQRVARTRTSSEGFGTSTSTGKCTLNSPSYLRPQSRVNSPGGNARWRIQTSFGFVDTTDTLP